MEALTPLSNQNPKMDKNYFLAIALSMLILLGYPYAAKKLGFWKTEPAVPAEQTQSASSAQAAGVSKKIETAKQTILQNTVLKTPEIPVFANERNAVYDITFSSLGGTVTKLHYLGEPDKPEKTHNLFYEGDPARAGLFALKLPNDDVDLSASTFKLQSQTRGAYEFVFEKAGQYRLTKKYVLDPQRPVIRLQVSFENLTTYEKNFPVELESGLYFDPADHHVEAAAMTDKVVFANPGKIKKKGFNLSDKVQWAGAAKMYFAVLAKPEWPIIFTAARVEDNTLWSVLRTEPAAVAPGAKVTREILIYAGPLKYDYLKEYGFDPIFSQGFFGLFKIWLLLALKFLYGFTHNYGWALILLTCVIKLLFTPLTHMSYASMKKMQAIQPKLKSLQERYKNDPQKLQREMMDLYKRNKVNPMGGCLPMLLQIPIFISFYQVLNETIELKGSEFIFWIHDLAQPDKLASLPFTLPLIGDSFNLLPLLMLGSMVWQQKLTPQMSTSPEQKQIMTLMPIIFGVMFYQMPSGLVLYWFVNNMLTIIHQVFINRIKVVLHHEDAE